MSAVLHAPVARPTEPVELTEYLYENYGQRVFTFCYSRLRNREEAQDAAQTTFIYVHRSLQRGVVPEFELAWLLKIAFNVCRGTRRSRRSSSARAATWRRGSSTFAAVSPRSTSSLWRRSFARSREAVSASSA